MRARTGLVAVASAAGALAARYARGRSRADAAAAVEVGQRLTDIGEVDSVSILPLVERLVDRPGLRGEAGVSYVIRAGGTELLFDCGLAQGRSPVPLEVNAQLLGKNATSLSAVVISHLHPDHVGGVPAQLRRTFAVPEALQLPRDVPALVPTEMSHAAADVTVVGTPRVIAPGVAVLPPLRRMLFWLGLVAEQALVINVRGFGLVLVTGCGHPPIESTLAAAEQALDVPVQAVVGGLHLPVHPLGTGLIPQAVLGNPHWPWQPISEADARVAIEAIRATGPKVVALSGHDSSPWTYDEFGRAFGPAYRTMRVGEPVVIDSSTGL